MRDQQHDDAHCMERLRQGDDLALNDLMRRWKEPLVTFCLRYTGNVTDACEIAQETFVKVHGSRHRYQQSAAFSTWLFSIAANLCRMRTRWRTRHPEVLEADRNQDTERVPDGIDLTDPSVESDRNTLAADLESAIQSLPHDLRVAFVLFEIQGQSYRDVSQILKCTEKAVERRLAKARERLRSMLEFKWRG